MLPEGYRSNSMAMKLGEPEGVGGESERLRPFLLLAIVAQAFRKRVCSMPSSHFTCFLRGGHKSRQTPEVFLGQLSLEVREEAQQRSV